MMGEKRMKKILALIITTALTLSLGTGVFAGSNDAKKDKEYQNALQLIKETNQKIDDKINKGIARADQLYAEYFEAVQVLQQKQGTTTINTLTTVQEDETYKAKIQALLLDVEEQLSAVNNGDSTDHLSVVEDEILEITSLLVANEPVTTISDSGRISEDHPIYKEYEDLTRKYVKKLDKIIENVYDQTKKMSERTVEKVSNVIEAVCVMKEYRFGHLFVWIDPIHVVGDN
jgi:hypothetical protein